jgi:plastocyanin
VKPHHHIRPLLVVAALATAACGGGNNDKPPAGSSGASTPATSSAPANSSGASSDAVKIADFKFAPATLTVAHGASVSVTNNDSTAHTFTADDGKSFDTGNLDPGASKSVSVAQPGSYPYHCDIHPFMHGKLVVS